jgi:uncharacterized protein
MRVETFARPSEFLARAGNFLATREAEHNLMLGLAARLVRDPQLYGHDPYLAVAEHEGRIVAAALRTPPHNLVLSELDHDDACAALAADAHTVFGSLPGVLGPSDGVPRFVQAWQALTGASGRLLVAQRIYRAQAAQLPTGVEGTMRAYEPADRELALAWLDAFAAEALREAPPLNSAELLDQRFADPSAGIVLWDTGQPVSLAAFGNPTPSGIRIGPVYTPPTERGRGYASALVAELTQALLAGGRRSCFLFTDLSNRTSNSIYQRIGYRPVTDVDQWAFE